MNPKMMGGIVLLVGGVILFLVGLNASDSMADRFSNFFTGRFTDQTVWFMVVGGVAAAVGLMMTAFNSRLRGA